MIDNASTDGSAAFIEENYPWVKTAVMKRNLGFAGGVNEGIRMSRTPYVLLLNNDTESDPDMIREMVRCMRSSGRIFSVQAKMVQFHNRALLDDAGDLYTVLGWQIQRGIGQRVSLSCRSREDVFSCCAGCAMYRRYMLDRIGYFDESHFAYLEDIDLGWRARIWGYRNVYCPEAVCYHVGSGTSGSKYNSFKVRLSARNSVYVNYKNMPLPQLLFNAPALIAGYLVKYLFFRRIGFGSDYAEGIREGLLKRRKCKKVFFRGSHLKNYFDIEMELIINTFIYVSDFFKRHLETA